MALGNVTPLFKCLILLLSCGLILSESTQRSGHTNNWAVLICTSRYWFNYRHVANTLSMYRSVKRLGIPDSHIILMLADDMSCNPRNSRPATVVNDAREQIDIYGEDIEVDYRGYEVTVENFIRVLTGRHDPSVPRSKRLLTDDRSNVIIYMTGHGGENFLKFQDAEEISNVELADAFEQMWQKRRYHELFYIIETCQANSMYRYFYSPNILATGTSEVGEESYSHHLDSSIGVPVIDRWTYYALDFLEQVTPQSKATMGQFFASFDPDKLGSHPGVRVDLYKRDLRKVLVTDFFGSQRRVELMDSLNLDFSAAGMEGGDTLGGGRKTTESSSPPVSHEARMLQATEHLHTAEEVTHHPVWRLVRAHEVCGVFIGLFLVLAALRYWEY